MYYLSDISVTIQVPPKRFGERIDRVILEIAREKYENSIHPDIGMIVAVLELKSLMPGKIVPGEGSTFHDVIFSSLTFRPLRNEYVEGEVAEVIKFGVFIRIGCTDCLCHISQISDDKFGLSDRGKGVLVGKETNKRLQLSDRVRAKIINTQIDHLSMKIAVTMRDSLLGCFNWINQIQSEGLPQGSELGSRKQLMGKRRRRRVKRENS